MRKIDPFRMLGRFHESALFLKGKYGLEFNQETDEWPDYFVMLSEKVSGNDREFCIRMAKASEELVKEMESTQLSQFEIDYECSKGRQETQYILRYNDENYADKILSDEDFLIAAEKEEQKRERESNKNWYIFLVILALISVGFVIYRLPYFEEQREYEEMEKTYEKSEYNVLLEAVGTYLKKYPESRYADEVSFMPVRYLHNSDNDASILKAIENYLEKNPNGKYSNECKAIIDSIWDMEIKLYKMEADKVSNKEGAQFMYNLLEYMKKNNVRTILLTGNPHLDLKDYNDYPSNVQAAMEYESKKDPIVGNNGKKFKSTKNFVSYKDHINMEQAKGWLNNIESALQDEFNMAFTSDFIKVKIATETELESNRTLPLFTVNYTLQTLEKDGFPEVYIFEGSGLYSNASGYYLGIQMIFDTKISIPGEGLALDFKNKEDVGEIYNRNVTFGAYTTMIDICVNNYIKSLEDKLNLNK